MGVEFVAVDNPHAKKLIIHILAAVAEREREAISEPTKEALASLRRAESGYVRLIPPARSSACAWHAKRKQRSSLPTFC